MFSYRHVFHAGNHADVLKHTVLIAALHHLIRKETALTVIDTHAGAGAYRLDGDHASKSGESAGGIGQLYTLTPTAMPQALAHYVAAVRACNADDTRASPALPRWYPGSPELALQLLRNQDCLRLFELHPTDGPLLASRMRRHAPGSRITVTRDDGFACTPALLPPPSRRGLVLCDPSYEIKSDYERVQAFVQAVVTRFATGTQLIWHPIIGRPEAHELPRRLKKIADAAGRPWLHANLTVRRASKPRSRAMEPLEPMSKGPSLPGSGVFVVNPPHTLAALLRDALPYLAKTLGHDDQGHHELTLSAKS